MEDVYSIKVKTKPDTSNLYPSERRYSASTVSGLAWVHIALAATLFILACLALLKPQEVRTNYDNSTLENATLPEVTTEFVSENATSNEGSYSYNSSVLILAPSLLAIFALSAGIAAILASVRWYVDRNITWLFVVSVVSSLCSLICFIIVAAWFVNSSDGTDNISEFYKDQAPFGDNYVIKNAKILDRNESHIVIANSSKSDGKSHLFTKRVLSINILIACFLEFLWSLLSVKIAYKGMRSNYKDDDLQGRGNCVSIVTKVKGNNAKNIQRNTKLIPQKPDLIEHYPKKIKRLFIDDDDTYYNKNKHENEAKENTETSSQFYKEHMMNYLNRCASLEGISNLDTVQSINSEPALNPIPEISINNDQNDTITHVSWGDTPDHTVYNQNNINFDKIFNFASNGSNEAKESDCQLMEEKLNGSN